MTRIYESFMLIEFDSNMTMNNYTVAHSSIIVLNVEVSDTTGDAMKKESW